MDSLRIVGRKTASSRSLGGVTDPEAKRHAIGEQFIREFETVAKEVDADYLVQGTIYPDRIESEGTIKSHHNVGGLPEVVDFDGIVEPMRDLYKDEVREVARELDLEEIISERMPFPGRAWPSASSAKSPRRNWKSPASRTTSSRRNSKTTTLAGPGRRHRQGHWRQGRQPASTAGLSPSAPSSRETA